jgi:hypothetical protein
MGIGIYAVARLTRHFTIETKQAKSDKKYILDINLSGLDSEQPKVDGEERYVAGYARLRTLSGQNLNDHGTTIILRDILPEARGVLSSADRWQARDEGVLPLNELKFHIGRAIGQPRFPSVPWSEKQSPLAKFKRLVDVLATKAEGSESSPSLDQTLDYYLAMVWRISLSAPLKYVEEHPFQLTNQSDVDFYSLSGNATPDLIRLKQGETIGKRLDVHVPHDAHPFKIFIDELELKRPVLFRQFTRTALQLIERPKMFIGKYPDEGESDSLSLTAYFYWSYETVPKENNGIMVRIAGASGTLFDPKFLGFRTSESVRLRQVSSEAFIEQGLENALNVDRESFVETDESVRELQRWVHRCMTRIFSRLKADQRAAAAEKRALEDSQIVQRVEGSAAKQWSEKRRGSAPTVIVSSKRSAPPGLPANSIFIGGIESGRRGGVERETVFASRLRAITVILDSFKVLDNLSDEERSDLLNAIAAVLERDD